MEELGERLFILMCVFNFFILYGPAFGVIMFSSMLLRVEVTLIRIMVIAAIADGGVVVAIARSHISMLGR